MVDRYELWRKEEAEGFYNFSDFERALFYTLRNGEHNYIYEFKLFLAEATEHIATQLVPIYRRIVLAQEVDEIVDLTTHPRFLVRTAANQKIDLLEGRCLRIEKIYLFPPKWPTRAWNAPRGRLRGIPTGP